MIHTIESPLELTFRENAYRVNKPDTGNCQLVSIEFAQMLQQRCEMLEVFLQKIANWEMPETNKFWDNGKTDPMSYRAVFGTDGEKEYV